MAFRRYVFPGIAGILIYLVLGLLFTALEGLFLKGCLFVVLFSYLMRVCDDISDYDKDKENGKALLRKKTLWGACVSIISVLILSALVWKIYVMLLPMAVILAGLLLKGKALDVLKLLFVPSVLLALFCSVFVFNYYVLIPIGFFVVADIYLIFLKGD